MRTVVAMVVLGLSAAVAGDGVLHAVGDVLQAVATSQSAPSPHRMPLVPAELLVRPINLRTGIGHAHDPVEGISPEAQTYYDQGLSYLHNYVWIEAARSFNQALR